MTVLCGHDGSAAGTAALEEALRRAAERGTGVRLVAAFRPPEQWATWAFAAAAGIVLPATHEVASRLRSRLRASAGEVRDRMATELDPVPEVVVRAEPGRPVDVLTAAARGAAELVVGHEGQGARSAPGSVALGCLLHAPCPVTVVPAPSGPRADPSALVATGAAADAAAP